MAPRQSFANSLGNAAAQNPLATALVGVGLLWMLGGGAQTWLAGLLSPAQATGNRRRRMPPSARATRTVGDMAGKLASSVSGAVNATYETASDVAESVGRQFSASHEQDADERPERWGIDDHQSNRSAGPMSHGTLQGLSDFLDQRPLALGVAGLALGAGIAASLPITDTERNMLGKASRRVGDTLSQSAGQVKEAAQATFDEARTQGLVPDRLDEAVRKR